MTELRKQLLQNSVDAGNSSVALLGASVTFPGLSADLDQLQMATVLVALYSDVDSADRGLKIQFSPDDATWFTTDDYTYVGGTGPKIYHVPRIFRYMRVQYTNGLAPQGTLFLQTTLLTGTVRGSSHRVDSDLATEDDGEVVKAIIAAKLPNEKYRNVNASSAGALQVVITDENQDAFGRVRISDPVTLLDSTFFYNLNPRQFEDISTGNGVVAHNANEKAADLSVTAGAPGTAGLQSYQYAHYNPGKSQLIFVTGCTDPLGNLPFIAGQKFEVGYFDDDNGIFARVDDTGAHVVRRSNTTGTPVDLVVDQADFNIDTLDGSGDENNPSGILVDPSKSQIVVIDLQFLGVGRVRVGLDISGRVFYAHEFQFANLNPGMYMQAGTLPVRWLLTDTTGAGWARSQAYCCMVTTEGGQEQDRGVPIAVGNPSTTAINAVSGVDTHIVSIRPLLAFNAFPNRIWNILEEVSLLNTGSNEVIVKVWYDADITGGAWNPVDASDSGMEFNITAAHAPGTGIVIGRFEVPATTQNKGAGGFTLRNRLPIAVDRLAANPIGAISITAAGFGGASAVIGTINWREVR